MCLNYQYTVRCPWSKTPLFWSLSLPPFWGVPPTLVGTLQVLYYFCHCVGTPTSVGSTLLLHVLLQFFDHTLKVYECPLLLRAPRNCRISLPKCLG